MRTCAMLAWSLVLSVTAQPLVPVGSCALDSMMREASGLLMVDGQLWTILDSGNPNALCQVDPATGTLMRSLHIPNAVNVDWEDLARDDQWVYIGDFGNNSGARTDLRVYRIALSALQDPDVQEVFADSIRFFYPEQTDFTPANEANNWDCEAFIARGDSLYLFSKNWLTSDSYLIALPATPGVHPAVRLDTLASQGLVTGADLDPSSGAIALIGHTTGYSPFVWRLSAWPQHHFFQGNAVRHAVEGWAVQMEGIAWSTPGSVYLCSEAAAGEPARIWSLELPGTDAIRPVASGTGIRAWPFPADDELFFESTEPLLIGLYDGTGRLVSQWWTQEGTGRLVVSGLPQGRYTLRAQDLPVAIAVVVAR